MRSRSHERLVDEMILAFADWRDASRQVDRAYRAWASSTQSSAADTFMRYRAALYGEEIAADVYADLVQRVGRVVTIGRGDAWQPSNTRANHTR